MYSLISIQFWTNEINCLERKYIQNIVPKKKEKFSAVIKESKRCPLLYCCYLSIKSEPTRRFNWKNSFKSLNEFFSVGKRQKSFRCLKSKLSFGIFMPFEVSKLSITRIIKIILKEKEIRVNYGIVIFRPTLMITIL